jgi:hypothetical protein
MSKTGANSAYEYGGKKLMNWWKLTAREYVYLRVSGSAGDKSYLDVGFRFAFVEERE